MVGGLMTNLLAVGRSTVILLCLLAATSVRSLGGEVIWVDDRVPTGAAEFSNGGDAWNWITGNPTPVSGARAHQSNLLPGLHEHYFGYAAPALPILANDVLFTYVYLDP